MHIQAWLSLALCAVHNFIQWYDPDSFFDPELGAQDGDNGDQFPGGPGLGEGPADAAERMCADQRHDDIAQEMWVDYQEELACHGLLLCKTYTCRSSETKVVSREVLTKRRSVLEAIRNAMVESRVSSKVTS